MRMQSGGPTLTLALLFTVGLLGEVDYQIIPPLLPLLANDFQVSPGVAGRVVPVYSLGSAISSLLFGYLSDQYGRKRFILWGLICFASVALFCQSARSMGIFFLARFFSGVTTGAAVTSATSYAADFFEYQRRGRAMGILSSAYFAAAILGIPLATNMAAILGWRPIFLLVSAIALLGAVFVWRFMRPDIRTESAGIEGRQSLSLVRLNHVLAAYLKRRDTGAILLASMLSSGAIVAFITFLSSHLTTEKHISVRQVGLIFLLCGLASLVGAPLSGILSDKWAKKPVLILSGTALSSCLFIIPRLDWNIWLFIMLGLAGLSIAFRMAPLLAITTELVHPNERGTLIALRNTLSQLGIAACALAASYCYLAGGYKLVGIFAASLGIISTLLILWFVNEPKSSIHTNI